MTRFQVGHSSVRISKRRGFWVVTVDGTAVGGRHMTEAQAAGAGLLWALGARDEPCASAWRLVGGTMPARD